MILPPLQTTNFFIMRIDKAYCTTLNRIIEQYELREEPALQSLQYACCECRTKLIVAAIDTRVQKPHFKSLKLHPHVEGCEYEVPEVIPAPADYDQGTAPSLLPNSLQLNKRNLESSEPNTTPKDSNRKTIFQPKATPNPSKQRSTTKGSISEVVNGYLANPANRSIEILTIDGVTRTYSEWFLTSHASNTNFGRLAIYRLTMNFKRQSKVGSILSATNNSLADYLLYTNDKFDDNNNYFSIKFKSIDFEILKHERSVTVQEYVTNKIQNYWVYIYLF